QREQEPQPPRPSSRTIEPDRSQRRNEERKKVVEHHKQQPRLTESGDETDQGAQAVPRRVTAEESRDEKPPLPSPTQDEAEQGEPGERVRKDFPNDSSQLPRHGREIDPRRNSPRSDDLCTHRLRQQLAPPP